MARPKHLVPLGNLRWCEINASMCYAVLCASLELDVDACVTQAQLTPIWISCFPKSSLDANAAFQNNLDPPF